MTLRGTLSRAISAGLNKVANMQQEQLQDVVKTALDVAKKENLLALRNINALLKTDPIAALAELDKLFPGTRGWVQRFINNLRNKDIHWNKYSLEQQRKKSDDFLFRALSSRIVSLIGANEIVKTEAEVAEQTARMAEMGKRRAEEEWSRNRKTRSMILQKGLFDDLHGGRRYPQKRRTTQKSRKKPRKKSNKTLTKSNKQKNRKRNATHSRRLRLRRSKIRSHKRGRMHS